MPSLKDLRNRISSVKATRKITQAMQMVAAAKLRRAQEAATASRPYTERMNAILANLNSALPVKLGVSPLLVGTGKEDVHLLVVLTAERGLCGAFNSSIVRRARQDIRRLQSEGKTVKIFCVGRKGHDLLRRDVSHLIVERTDFRDVKQIGFMNAETIGSKLIEMFEAGEFDVATIYYGAFKSVISQVPTALQIIPASLPEKTEGTDGTGRSAPAAIYDYEPDEEELLNFLLRRNVSTQIYRGLLENAASEQGARMTAMDNATRNAGDMIQKLTLNYNRARQAQITKELIEIISGAEAL